MPLAKVLHITDDWKQLKSPIYWAWHAETTVGSHCLGSAIWLPMGKLPIIVANWPLLELPSTYESYPALLEEFTNVMKEEQACFVVLLSMEDVNNLKWTLRMLWNEYFEICFLVFTIFLCYA